MLHIKFHKASQFGKTTEQGIHLLNPTQKDLDDSAERAEKDGFETIHLYCDAWTELKAWTTPSSYMGHQYWGYIGVVGKHRDSDALSRSNYRSIVADLHAELDNEPQSEEFPLVEEASASHWAVGHCETAMVYWQSVKALNLAAKILDCLSDYPVYDDSDFSEEEHEEQQETFRNYSAEFCCEVLAFLTDSDPRKVHAYDAEDREALETCAAILFSEDCGYRGLEDAWVRAKDVARAVKSCSYEFKREAERGNVYAKRLLAKCEVSA